MAKSIMQSRPSFFSRIRETLRWAANDLGFWSLRPAADPIAELMASRAGEVQRMEYQPIGIITQIQTPAGWIIFPNGRGPALARFDSDKRPDLLDLWEWDGLPDYYELTDQLCPDCQAPCVECNEEIKCSDVHAMCPDNRGDHIHDPRACSKCQGADLPPRKILIAGEMKEFKAGERPCIYGNQLECCGGTGVIASQDDAICPSCGGTGRVPCRRCAGTSYMSTGKSADGKTCASCGGMGRVRKQVIQSIESHVGIWEYATPIVHAGLICLGPILKMYLSDENKATQIWLGKPDDLGRYPHIVSHFHINTRACIEAGILRPELTSSSHRNRGRQSRRGGVQ